MTTRTPHATLAWLLTAALALATVIGCDGKKPDASANAPTGDQAAADGAKAPDGKGPASAPAGKKGPASAPAGETAKKDDGAKAPDGKGPATSPAQADKAAAGGDDKGAPAEAGALGKNDPAFLEGIEGKEGGKLMATITTTMGSFTCELYEKQAPNAVMNFVGLARGLKPFKDVDGQIKKRPFYNGIQFHRVIPKFMVQVGDPTATGTFNPGYGFANEIDPSLKHTEGGILSMANTGRPNSNGSQFFITEVATPHLDGRHPIFGKCDQVDLVKEIARVPTGPGNKPLKPVTIEKVTFQRK